MDTMNKLSRISLFALLLSPIASAETLTILNWEDYLSDEVVTRWEQETGSKIKQVYFDSDAERDEMLIAYDSDAIDIAVIDETTSRSYGKSEILLDLSTANLPNTENNDELWSQRCSQYSVPYTYGTIGIAYRTDKVKSPPASWADFLNPPDDLTGHIAVLKESSDTLLPALMQRGYSNNTSNKDELKQAFKDMEQIIPHVLTFEYPITYLSANPEDDQLHMAQVYSGDHWTMNEIQNSENWEYVVPEEGTVIWTDCLAILNSSKKKDLALQFVDFINRPEIAAINSEEIYFASTSSAARELQSEEFLADQSVYPGKKTLEGQHYYGTLDIESRKLRNRIVQSLVLKHEAQ